MDPIAEIEALQVLDSRGQPTVSVRVRTANGFQADAMVPSGASTGIHEAHEQRDGDQRVYAGKGVLKACESVRTLIRKGVIGRDPLDQQGIDRWMIESDGTPNKSRYGANAILGVSMAVARLSSLVQGRPLYRTLTDRISFSLPRPLMNVLNGGAHADNNLAFQEFMIAPKRRESFSETLRTGVEVYHRLKSVLKKRGLSSAVGDEGGFAPCLEGSKAALDLLSQAIEESGYRDQIEIALDCAASEFFEGTTGLYQGRYSAQEQIDELAGLVQAYPIFSIEDGLAQEDWIGWRALTEQLPQVQIVGDDLFVTQKPFLERGIVEGVGNAILIKLNQVGSVTETLETVALAQCAGYEVILSHRSGDTEDPFIADFAVACGANQIKTGAPCRSERVAKYNRLLWIEQELFS